MNKKQLKQRVAEVFGDINITTKSQYIRDLIENNVDENMTISDEYEIRRLRETVDRINERQINGYSAFEEIDNNIQKLSENIISNNILLWLILICEILKLIF